MTQIRCVFIMLLCVVSAVAQNAALAPTARPQFFDANGKPLTGGKLCTYQAGTTTPLTTYADAGLTTANANPIVLDASGRPTVGIYFSANTYKIVARAAGTDGTCSTGTVQWTQDNVADVGQLLRRDLADSTTGYGGALVAFKQAGAGAVVTDVQAEMAKTYRVSQFGTFAQAVAAATGHTLLIDSAVTLPADTTLPASVALRMDRAGLFKVATGSTLTIEGPLETGLFQIFSTEATDTGYGGAVVLSSVTELYPQWFGAQADGVTDDAAAIQAAVNTCPSRGCRIWFSPGTYLIGSSIVPKSNVAFVGPGFTMESSPTTPQAIIKGNGAFSLFSTSSATNSITWQGLALEGTADSGSRGIDLANPSHDPTIRDCFFDTFGDEAIRLLGGLSARLEHVFVQNAVLVRARADYIGAVDVSNTDARLDHVDATASVIDPGGSIPSGQIGDGYVASIVIRGANSHLTNSFGQISQVGIVVAASYCKIMNNRADLNQGAGFVVTGGENQFIGNHSFRNGQDADNTYPGFDVSGGANIFVGNSISSLSADARRMNYGFLDSTTAVLAANQYMANREELVTGELHHFTATQARGIAYFDSAGNLIAYPSLEADRSLRMKDLTGGADAKLWDWLPLSDQIKLRAVNDAENAAADALVVTRAGTVITSSNLFGRVIAATDPSAPAGQRSFRFLTNYGAGYNQIALEVLDDAGGTGQVFLIDRDGATVNWTRYPKPLGVGLGTGTNPDTSVSLFTGTGIRDSGTNCADLDTRLSGPTVKGVAVWCPDCNVVDAAPHVCTCGGTGAWAFRSDNGGGAWKCPF